MNPIYRAQIELLEKLQGVDHVFVGEAESGLAALAEGLERGRAGPVYRAADFPEVDASPVPRFDLLDLGAYASMAVQRSRGCPFACEFCDIWKLYGRRSRVKSPERVTTELDALHAAGWRGAVFFVDDNFIGNRRLAKRSLAALEDWQRDHGFPFAFYTETSVNVGCDDALMDSMRDAGFDFVFLGIETPSGPLGQGLANGVGMALAERMLAARFNRPGLDVIDHYTWVFLGPVSP